MKPELPDVTLVAVSDVALPATVRALHLSMDRAAFGKALLLSHERPPGLRAEWRQIPELRSRMAYSRFMLHELADHIDTSHALCIQWDGFVLDGNAWNPAFLDFDYIGAVWPQFDDGKTVGNGGFSLRSAKLLRACQNLKFEEWVPEDLIIARTCRAELETLGIRFAPERVARQFAFERTKPTGREFGFHGAFNLVRFLSRQEAVELFRSLESGLLTPGEHRELLRWAVSRGRGRLALILLDRLRRLRQAPDSRAGATPV